MGYYCHEPFETTYYSGAGLEEVLDKLSSPLDLGTLKSIRSHDGARALVVKEMPYQVGDNLPILARMATQPLVFLMRDPRSSIASRMRKKREVGDSPFYPEIESGWELWQRQIEWCREHGVPRVLVDSADFRNEPEGVFPELFEALGLPFDPDMLSWRPCPDVELDNLGGRHRHLYGAVLRSSGLRADPAGPPELDTFREARGWRDHVARCLEIYLEMGAAAERIRPAATARR